MCNRIWAGVSNRTRNFGIVVQQVLKRKTKVFSIHSPEVDHDQACQESHDLTWCQTRSPCSPTELEPENKIRSLKTGKVCVDNWSYRWRQKVAQAYNHTQFHKTYVGVKSQLLPINNKCKLGRILVAVPVKFPSNFQWIPLRRMENII